MKIQYPEAARVIQNWIMLQKLPAGAPLPPARSLADQFGFKLTTTERACNILISKGVISRTGYKLRVGGKDLSHSPIEGTVYVVSYGEPFCRNVERFLASRGVKSKGILLISSSHKGSLTSALRKVYSENPIGLILKLPSWIKGLETVIDPDKIPTVICAEGVPPELNFNGCGMDFYRGTEKALRHLFDLGHRNIAHLTSSSLSCSNSEIANCYGNVCLQLALKQSATQIWQPKSDDPEMIQDTFLQQFKKHPEVTALFGRSKVIQNVASIPTAKAIALVGFNHSGNNDMTTIELPEDGIQLAQWASNEIISLIQTFNSGRPQRLPHQAFFMPALLIRGSSLPLRSNDAKLQVPVKTTSSPRMTPQESWRKTYSPLKQSGDYWKQLDLSKLANHSMTKKNGWLGAEPLLHFPSGVHSIHGIPFDVMDPTHNRGQSVITFRSPHSHSTGGESLPISVKIPIAKCVKALYFLHGCGWAQYQEPFARYIFHFKNRKKVIVPLIPAGVSRKSTKNRLGSFNPNIQDWWPLDEPMDYPHAHHVTIFNPADPIEYERYLYTLEWLNPRPMDEISEIEVRVDPEAGPALALIAVTALI